jgi:hypothetical protein
MNGPLICYPDMFGTEVTSDETDETRSTAQFEDGFIFEGRRTSLEEVRTENLRSSPLDATDKISRTCARQRSHSPRQQAKRSLHTHVQRRARVLR